MLAAMGYSIDLQDLRPPRSEDERIRDFLDKLAGEVVSRYASFTPRRWIPLSNSHLAFHRNRRIRKKWRRRLGLDGFVVSLRGHGEGHRREGEQPPDPLQQPE